MAVVRKVIVRGYRDEPWERVAVQVHDRIAYLADPMQLDAVIAGKGRPIPAPLEDLYLFDEAIYVALTEQWMDQGSTDPETWRRLRPF